MSGMKYEIKQIVYSNRYTTLSTASLQAAVGTQKSESHILAVLYTASQKKQDTLLMSINSWNIDRFSNLFHC